MLFRAIASILGCIFFWVFSPVSHAQRPDDCHSHWRPVVSFVEFESIDVSQEDPSPLTVKAKLKLPVRYGYGWRKRCFVPKKNVSAVVILHGSAGVDFRGEFYTRALNAAGIATLEIDMWEARGVTGPTDRPRLPIVTYPDAFAALKFLSTHDNIDPDRIGVMGFSWGAVITMASAEELYAEQFGDGLRFAAHVAHYPVCYAYNNPIGPLNPPAEKGFQFENLTGAPLLIQIGTEDDYDNGAGHCFALVEDLDDIDKKVVEIAVYQDAFHGWDRLQVPITVRDPFADEGSFFSTGETPTVEIAPNPDQAYASRKRAVKFFRHNL